MPYNTRMDWELIPRQIGGSVVLPTGNGWRLDIPAGDSRQYRLAQLDDYVVAGPRRFKHSVPWEIRLRARVSQMNLPGTWGFGLWNDPFGFAIGFGGHPWRIPSLPQTAWFFHASSPNWLSLHDGQTPGDGFFAGVFRSVRIPSFLFFAGTLAIPFLAWRPASRLMRQLAGKLIQQEANGIITDVTQWHEYSLRWENQTCNFSMDENQILQTAISPPSPLGLVIWIDNQFARWTPEGRIGYGLLENPSGWLEVRDLVVV